MSIVGWMRSLAFSFGALVGAASAHAACITDIQTISGQCFPTEINERWAASGSTTGWFDVGTALEPVIGSGFLHARYAITGFSFTVVDALFGPLTFSSSTAGAHGFSVVMPFMAPYSPSGRIFSGDAVSDDGAYRLEFIEDFGYLSPVAGPGAAFPTIAIEIARVPEPPVALLLGLGVIAGVGVRRIVSSSER